MTRTATISPAELATEQLRQRQGRVEEKSLPPAANAPAAATVESDHAAGAASDKHKKRNKSKDDIPFPVVYFGFLAGFVAIFGRQMYAKLPVQSTEQLVPDLSATLVPLCAVFVACPLISLWRAFLKRTVFGPMAENWAGLHPEQQRSKYDKFTEQAWLALHYTIATVLGVVVLHDKPWWPPVVSKEAVDAISAPQEDREKDQLDFGMQALYTIQLGFYTLELVTLLRSKQRRSDATMYLFHHIYTIFLMGGSWMSYNHRVGSIVLFLHDIGDVFLPIGKCYTYAEEHIRKTKTKFAYELHKMIGMTFFVMFVIFFTIPRLVLYGKLVFDSILSYSWLQCCGVDTVTGFCGPCKMSPLWWTFPLTFTLGLLYPMHVYWFYLIAKMAFRLIFAPGKYDDVRSGSDKDD